MQISHEILKAVLDGDRHTKMNDVKFSTSPRAIVTLEYMIEQYPLIAE